MADKITTTTATGSERMLDKVFDKVAGVELPGGATRLDVELEMESSGGSPGFSLKLHIERPAGAAPKGSPEGKDDEDAVVLFGPRGHGTIAFIALADLKSNKPAVHAKVMDVLTRDPLGRADPFAAANWPDRIRPQQPETGAWHFIDIIFDTDAEDDGSTPELPEAPHCLSQLAVMRGKLGALADPQEKADTLCWLFHLAGDLHQPLHCITRVSSAFPAPEGDRGGNGFKLRGNWKSLHSLWDDSVNLSLPDSAEDLAASIMKEHTRATLADDLAQKDPEAWARASYAIAKESAYGPLLDEGDRPTPNSDYLRTARGFGQRQAALGGYRLADILAEIFG